METVNGTLRKKHVLIVDDDIPLSWSLKETLERDGYEATIVPDGGLALKFVQEHQLDAVVCDLQMSRVEGDLLYATVERSNPALARRFIFITGLDDWPLFQKFIDTIRIAGVAQTGGAGRPAGRSGARGGAELKPGDALPTAKKG